MRGIGSGLAENQKVVGAQDPQAAAVLAAMPEAEMQEAMERMAQENAALDEMRNELASAFAQTAWRPKVEKAPTDWQQAIAEVPPPTVKSWFAQWEAYTSTQADPEDPQAALEQDPFRLGPDHPAYQPMMDLVRRRALESKVKPMDFGDLIFKGYAEQEVPIREGFALVLRSISTTHALWLEQRLAGDTVHDRHQFSLWQLAVGIHAAGGKPLGVDIAAITEKKEEFYEELDKRMKQVGRWPQELTNDLIVHYVWFTGRVRKLLHGNVTEKVGN